MRRSRWGVGVVTAGGVALLMWLVTAPSVRLFNVPRMPLHIPEAPQRTRVPPTERPPTRTATTGPTSPFHQAPVGSVASWVWTVVAATLITAAVVCLAVWVVRELRALRREAHVEETDVDVLPEVPEALVAEPETFRRVLLEGAPRNGIVACWARLEDATRDAGVPMAAHETSSEYTERVVGSWVRDGSALRRFAELYRVARFSRHDLAESDRDAAAQALNALLADLRQSWEARRAH